MLFVILNHNLSYISSCNILNPYPTTACHFENLNLRPQNVPALILVVTGRHSSCWGDFVLALRLVAPGAATRAENLV
jgi:hypothetical protein